MESLPLLPGYVFCTDPTSKDYKLKQKFKFVNGFRMLRDNYPDDLSCSAQFVELDPALTYGRAKLPERPRFIPHYVQYERKCLRLEAYFKQGIFGSADESFRVRKVRLLYYLEDDTLAVFEPRLDNVGFNQGKLVRRSKVPKPDEPNCYYHWKDLNIAINIEIYGVVYRVYDCDVFTREFLTSQGIDVNEPESAPPDPYIEERRLNWRREVQPCKTKTERAIADDKRYLFLEYDGMILTFDALWDERKYKLRYFLADDTIAIMAVRGPADPVEGKGLLLKRTKVPRDWSDTPTTFPSSYLEKTDNEIKGYYGPADIKVGETVFIFGRRFFLYDCDKFTRKYYSEMLGIDQPERIRLPEESEPCGVPAQQASGKPGKEAQAKDLLRRLYNFPKRLRYSLEMVAVHPEDEGRQFIMEYGLSDGRIRISEPAQRNSGRRPGCFLGWSLVPKPDESGYYSPEDFHVNGRLCVFGHWFIITGTEPFVYNYMRANPTKFSQRLLDNVEQYLRCHDLLPAQLCDEKPDEKPVEQHEKPKETNCATQRKECVKWADECTA